MKVVHEVLIEICDIIRDDKSCSRSSNKLQTRSISHIGLCKIVISFKQKLSIL